MSTLLTKETTKTLSSKMPSRKARSAPKTASSAATTAIGQVGLEPERHVGLEEQARAARRASRPRAAIIGRSPGRSCVRGGVGGGAAGTVSDSSLAHRRTAAVDGLQIQPPGPAVGLDETRGRAGRGRRSP